MYGEILLEEGRKEGREREGGEEREREKGRKERDRQRERGEGGWDTELIHY